MTAAAGGGGWGEGGVGWGRGLRGAREAGEEVPAGRLKRVRDGGDADGPPARPEVILNSSGEISDLVYFVITDASSRLEGELFSTCRDSLGNVS